MAGIIALYSGTFDPPTNGHEWVIKQAAKQYDEVYVAIGVNTTKSVARFSLSDRKKMLHDLCGQFGNVKVASFEGLYQADFADLIGANFIIRGARNESDFAFEMDVRHINSFINPKIETAVFVPPKDLLQISSTTVVGLVGFEGWRSIVSQMVSPLVLDYLIIDQQAAEQRYIVQRISNLFAEYNIGADTIIDNILACYNAESRHYHDLRHLYFAYRDFDDCKEFLVDSKSVELALVYHDIIYDVSKTTNEVDSADRFDRDFLPFQHMVDRDKIKELIRNTSHDGTPVSEDAKYLLDIDLANLGKSRRIFHYYNELARKEYPLMTDSDFHTGRSEIFAKFLRRRCVYYTDYFRDRYEANARVNMLGYINHV